MGFLNNTTSINIKGNLTPYGRERLAKNGSLTITSFSIGDSDSNYNVFEPLDSGEVPDFSGDYLSTYLNNGGYNYSIKNRVLFKGNLTNKNIEPTDNTLINSFSNLGYNDVILTNYNIINRNDINVDRLSALFYSFNLPINNIESNKFNNILSNNGGYADTSLSFLSNENILVIPIPSTEYGELIDGKSIKLELPLSGGTIDIYSTYENKGDNLKIEDTRYSDTSNNIKFLGDNVSLLFSDYIKHPNGDLNKSWATGYSSLKPFSSNKKELFNFKTNSNLNRIIDEPIGLCYLNKGFIVITNQDVINEFDITASGYTLNFNSVIKTIKQNVTCLLGRNEFFTSQNRTFNTNDTIRITEIGLYDNSNNLILIGKPNKTILKNRNEIKIINLTIDY